MFTDLLYTYARSTKFLRDGSNVNLLEDNKSLTYGEKQGTYICHKTNDCNMVQMAQVQINKNFQRKNVNIFLPISFNRCCGYSKEPSQYVLCAQKNHLIETVLLSTQNICFG